MPELPDLVYIEKKLAAILPGQRVKAIDVKEPIILRVLLADSLEEILRNAMIDEIYRHGPFLAFKIEPGLEMIVHPMLAGRFKITEGNAKPGRGLCFSLRFQSGKNLHYLDTKKMGKAYFIERGKYEQIPRFTQQGVDITSGTFTFSLFQKLISGQRKQVRVFLMDQTKLSAIGNAYADEILFEAGLHPKTLCTQLSEPAIEQLYQSIKKTIAWGIYEVEQAAQPIEVKVRDHVRVRNRKDQPCPKCGTTIRRAGVLGYDAFFCPTCQPPQRKQFIDWN